VYHIDLYRVDATSDYTEFGFEDCIAGDGICLIEWAERAEHLLPPRAIRVRMVVCGEGRRLEIEGLAAVLEPPEQLRHAAG
jgi:tRNA threonylcarbamoyladenosine biosynthesis protein TsaE